MSRYQQILKKYKKEYGLRKYRKIDEHISNSRKVKELIQRVIKNGTYPYGEDLVVTVLSHFRYSLATSETVLVASLVILRNLITQIKSSSMSLNDQMINKITQQILKECHEAQIR